MVIPLYSTDLLLTSNCQPFGYCPEQDQDLKQHNVIDLEMRDALTFCIYSDSGTGLTIEKALCMPHSFTSHRVARRITL